jgi:hypothetical protein
LLTDDITTKPGFSIDELIEEYGTDVDEATATLWLSTRNEDNRNLKPKKLAGYVRDMASDHWYTDGAPIRFGRDGRLYDGQHRLEALRRASRARVAQGGQPLVIRFLVVNDLEEDARIGIDTGAVRTFNDQAVIASGLLYARNVVPIGNRVYNWLEAQNPVPLSGNRFNPTESEFKDFYLKHMASLNQAAYWGGHLMQRIKLPTVAGGFAHFLIHEAAQAHLDETGVDVAQLFFSQLSTGAELVEGHPAKTLRETVARRRANREGLNTDIGLALTLRAWNAYTEERLYRMAVLPEGKTVTNSNLALPEAPQPGWTGEVYRSLHQ